MGRTTLAAAASLSLAVATLLTAGPASAELANNTAGSPDGALFPLAYGSADPPDCAKTGVSTPTLMGKAPIEQGTYEGKYLHISATVTIGAQDDSTLQPFSVPVDGVGAISDITGTFSIADSDGTDPQVTGTLDGTATPRPGARPNVGACYGVGAGDHFAKTGLRSGTIHAITVAARTSYTEGDSDRQQGEVLLRQEQLAVVSSSGRESYSTSGPFASFRGAYVPVDTSPAITVRQPIDGAVYDLGEPVTADFDCADDFDPAPSCSGTVDDGQPVDTSSIGQHQFSVISYDSAGNRSEETVTYTVRDPAVPTITTDGFFEPVSMDVVNVANAGQTIPLKFSVTRNDHAVTDLSTVRVSVTGLPCALGASTDLVEEYTSGSKGLINRGDGSYQFNWASPKHYRGSCKTLSLEVAPGVVISADFQFPR